MNRDQINSELEDMGSLLAHKTPIEKFDVPDGYFDHFEASIVSKLTAKAPKTSQRISLYTCLKYAAAAAIIVSFGVYLFDNPKETGFEYDIDYVLENINDVNEELFFDIEHLNELNEFSSAEIPEESIIEFLDLYIGELDYENLAILE